MYKYQCDYRYRNEYKCKYVNINIINVCAHIVTYVCFSCGEGLGAVN